MLQVTDLAYGPPGRPPLLRNLSFALKVGEFLQIRGGNGTGKSLLLRTLLGYHEAEAGRVQNGFRSVAYLPQAQNPATHLPFTLRDVALSCGRAGADRLEGLGLLPEAKHGLAWNRASGGERQRALLSRVLLPQSDLLVLDEPFNHLDHGAVAQAQAVLRAVLESPARPALLLVTHGTDPSDWLPRAPEVLNLDGWRNET